MIPTLVWTLPRPPKSKYKGGFPLHFEENLVKLLGYPELILQPFGGRATVGLQMDIDPSVKPDIVGDAHQIPFEDDRFDMVILDPPYSQEEAIDLYGTRVPLRPALFKQEAVRVTKPGGWVVIYTDKVPRRPARCNLTLRIMVVLRSGHSARVCDVFQKRKPGMPFYGSEPGET